MLDCQLCGLKPWGYHLSNVLLHAAATILLFYVFWRMTGDVWPSALVAALFAIHPLQVETVAWVGERKGVLGGLFFALTLVAYDRYARGPFSWARYLLVTLSLALGLLAKPVLVTLPFLLLLLDVWPLGRLRRSVVPDAGAPSGRAPVRPALPLRLLAEKIPLLFLAAGACVATIQSEGGNIQSLDALPVSSRLGSALVSYVAYICQLIYPVGLAVFYPRSGSGLSVWRVAGAVLALAAVSSLCLAYGRRRPYLFVGWFWYLGTLLPMIGIVQIGGHVRADRYMYLPQIGLGIMLAWAAKGLADVRPAWRWAIAGAWSLALAVAMGLACRQAGFWRDSETLWTHALECTRDNFPAHSNLGSAMLESGRAAEAVEQFEQALRIRPDYSVAHSGLGNALGSLGRPAEAIEHYEEALRISPNYAEVHSNLGLAWVKLGRTGEAIEHYREALRIKPDYARAHSNLGNALCRSGRVAEAIDHYQEALRIDPRLAESHFNLALASRSIGRNAEATEHFQRALRLAEEAGNRRLAQTIRVRVAAHDPDRH